MSIDFKPVSGDGRGDKGFYVEVVATGSAIGGKGAAPSCKKRCQGGARHRKKVQVIKSRHNRRQ